MHSATTTGLLWNGPICPTCSACYLGTHQCDAADLLRKAAELTEMARRLQSPPLPVDRTAGCPCRPENGGSGVCGCILGGYQIDCAV